MRIPAGPTGHTPIVAILTASGSITAAKSRFDDARDVTVTVHTGTGRTVASPKSGTITAYGCAPGQTIDSGTSFIAVDEVPLLALHTAVPPFRDLQSGMRGRDGGLDMRPPTAM